MMWFVTMLDFRIRVAPKAYAEKVGVRHVIRYDVQCNGMSWRGPDNLSNDLARQGAGVYATPLEGGDCGGVDAWIERVRSQLTADIRTKAEKIAKDQATAAAAAEAERAKRAADEKRRTEIQNKLRQLTQPAPRDTTSMGEAAQLPM
jgi:hypothetical protein